MKTKGLSLVPLLSIAVVLHAILYWIGLTNLWIRCAIVSVIITVLNGEMGGFDERDEDSEPPEEQETPAEEQEAPPEKQKLSDLRKQFEAWQRANPRAATEIGIVISQLDLVKKQKRIFRDLLRDEENRKKCSQHEELFEQLLAQTRQNFTDMANIFVAAGANLGEASRESINANLLETELGDNLKKIELMKRVNEEALKTINQGSNAMEDVVAECSLSAIEKANAMKSDADKATRTVASGGSPFMERAMGNIAASGIAKARVARVRPKNRN